MLTGLLELEKNLHGFTYPKAFLKAVELHLTDLDIWYIMDAEQVLLRFEGLRQRYPKGNLSRLLAGMTMMMSPASK